MVKATYYKDLTFRPYFDMRKFENSIYNKEILREQRINVRKKQKIVDNIIMMFFTICLTFAIIVSAMVAYHYIKIAGLDRQISKLELTLENERLKNESDRANLDKVVEYDDLKMKAYLELNMILPTDKNIIYFDKSDHGFVRQYENIR